MVFSGYSGFLHAYTVHSMKHENVAFMSNRPLYAGYNYTVLFINEKNETALYRQ